jgi:hypothetical protein
MSGKSPTYHQVIPFDGIKFIERVTIFVVYALIVHKQFPSHWTAVFDALWLHSHFALMVVEFAVFSVSHSLVTALHNIDSMQLHSLEGIAMWALFTTLNLLITTVRDLIEDGYSGEYIERLVFVVVVFITNIIRIVFLFTASRSAIPTSMSPQTHASVHPTADGILVKVAPSSSDNLGATELTPLRTGGADPVATEGRLRTRLEDQYPSFESLIE